MVCLYSFIEELGTEARLPNSAIWDPFFRPFATTDLAEDFKPFDLTKIEENSTAHTGSAKSSDEMWTTGHNTPVHCVKPGSPLHSSSSTATPKRRASVGRRGILRVNVPRVVAEAAVVEVATVVAPVVAAATTAVKGATSPVSVHEPAVAATTVAKRVTSLVSARRPAAAGVVETEEADTLLVVAAALIAVRRVTLLATAPKAADVPVTVEGVGTTELATGARPLAILRAIAQITCVTSAMNLDTSLRTVQRKST
nr:unnamed protein product [Spirometra erinaceieuropaei]